MKVCVLATSFPRWKGDFPGSAQLEYFKEIARGGVDVQAIAPRDVGSPAQDEFDGVKVHRFQYARKPKVAYGGGIPVNIKKSLAAKFQVPFFMRGFKKAGLRYGAECDVVHACWILAGHPAVSVKERYGIPLVVSVFGRDLNNLPEKGMVRKIALNVLDKADMILCQSNELRDKAVALGYSGDKVRTLTLGVYPGRFGTVSKAEARKQLDIPEGVPVVLSLGRLSPEKALDNFIAAAKMVLATHPDARFLVVGDGPEMSRLKALAKHEGLTGSVSFAGNQPFDQVHAYYSAADVYAIPSLSEGLPLTVLEAMASRCAVVGSRVGGIPDAIEEARSGFVIPPGDAVALGDALERALGDPERLEVMGLRGREIVEERYDMALAAAETIALYGKLTGAEGGR